MMRRIKAMGIKMVLSGEGADEVFGGYLYFHKAPNARELHEETVRKLDALHKYDCLRANKSSAAWGVETRVPFLDREFLDVAMAFDPQAKMVRPGRHGEALLREAFAGGYLPDEILWRQKEQFSDGVGYRWIDSLKANAAAQVSDLQMANARYRFPYNTPATKEAYFYRGIFESHFPGEAAARLRPGRPQHRVQHADRHRLGRQLRPQRRPLGPRRHGRARSIERRVALLSVRLMRSAQKRSQRLAELVPSA